VIGLTPTKPTSGTFTSNVPVTTHAKVTVSLAVFHAHSAGDVYSAGGTF